MGADGMDGTDGADGRLALTAHTVKLFYLG